MTYTAEQNREYVKQWRKDNPDRAREISRSYYERNREKVKAAVKKYRDENAAAVAAADRARYAADPSKKRASAAKWARENPAKKREIDRAKCVAAKADGRAAIWSKRYRASHQADLNAHGAKRRARRISACPAWLTRDQKKEMKRLYRRARIEGMEVDHIVPLQGKNVCGLHVPWNLQLLTLEENRAKGNKLLADAGDADAPPQGELFWRAAA